MGYCSNSNSLEIDFRERRGSVGRNSSREVDFVEEREGKLFGYEFKWKVKNTKIQQEWLNTYDNASFEVIHKENFLQFIT